MNTINIGTGGIENVAQGTVTDSNQQVGGAYIKAVEKQLIKTIEKANKLQANSTECEFSIHQSTKQIMIKIVDTNTKEVLKEIPSEKILDMVANMCELAGIFVDAKR